jgi:hypothetical protein
MDTLSMVLGIVLAAALIIFISQPLRRSRRVLQTGSDLDTLLAQRESLYTQIRELDFDHATGKITDTDHSHLRAQLVKEAAEVLRRIDASSEAQDEVEAAVAARRKRKPAASAEVDLEAAIAARRQRKPAPASSSSADAELEAAIAARRRTLACPTCGKPIQAGDAFCSKCGTPLGTQVAR